MAQDNKVSTPGAFGGLMRYDEEYGSRFMIKPEHVLAYIVLIIIAVIVAKKYFPVVI